MGLLAFVVGCCTQALICRVFGNLVVLAGGPFTSSHVSMFMPISPCPLMPFHDACMVSLLVTFVGCHVRQAFNAI